MRLKPIDGIRRVAYLACGAVMVASPAAALDSPPGTSNPDYAESPEPLTIAGLEVSREVRAGRPATVRVELSAPARLAVRVARAQGDGWTRAREVRSVRAEGGANTVRLPGTALPSAGRYRVLALASDDAGRSDRAAKRVTAR